MADRIRRVGPGAAELADYLCLTDVALRTRKEPAEGMFIAEGEKVIRRAVEAGYPVRSLLLEEKWLPGLADVVDRVDAPVYLADLETLTAVTGYAVHRGALAAMSRLPLAAPDDLLATARTVAVLEDIVSHTNLGAILRCAAAFGVDAVLVTPGCADPLYRRSVRVSMGTVFQVPWTLLGGWPEGLDFLRAAGFTVVGLTPSPAARSLDTMGPTWGDRSALVLGTEGDGLSGPSMQRADHLVRIPMAGGVDSLNVAAAAAVAFYAQGRRPRSTGG